MKFEPRQQEAYRARPPRSRYVSDGACKRHGPHPIRYTNTKICVECAGNKIPPEEREQQNCIIAASLL